MRIVIRRLRHDPGLGLVIVLTVALGVGVNAGVFSLIHGLHRPLPVRDADRLVTLATRHQGGTAGAEGMEYRFSYPALKDFREQAGSFSDVLAFNLGRAGLSAGGPPQQFFFSYVTGNYFPAFGIQPVAGRLFTAGEGETPDAEIGIVLGYACWQKRFGGDRSVIGRQVRLNGAPATIVGVAQKGFHGAYANTEMDGYVPLALLARAENGQLRSLFHDRATPRLTVFGVLKPGVGQARAQNEVDLIARRLEQSYPATDKGISVRVLPETWARPVPIPSMVTAAPFIAALFLLLGGFVLLLACLNIGNVLLVRAAAREREMAVRAALGSGRARLVRHVLAESVVLALAGGVAGIVLGDWACAAISSVPIAPELPSRLDLSFDWRVFAYALGAALAAGIGAGLWPALAASRADISAVLHECGRGGSATRGASRVRNVLVAAEVAGSLILLIVAGVFVRSLGRARVMDLGFDPRQVATFTLDAAYVGYTGDRVGEFYRDLERRVRELPGVESASAAYTVPMNYAVDAGAIEVEGRPPESARDRPLVLFNSVTPDYLRTMRIEVRRGRGIRESDQERSPRVAVVNETMARRLWPNQDALGRRFRIDRAGERWWEVVGVAQDGKYLALYEPPLPYFYVPMEQHPSARRVLQVRSALAPGVVLDRVQQEIRALNPDLPVSTAGMMVDTLESGLGFYGFRLGAYLSGAMGLVGLALAIVGVYGVVSHAAGQRTHEIGVRMALGAASGDVLRLVVGQGLVMVSCGVVSGGLAAWGLGTVIAKRLNGTIQADAAAFFVPAVFLAALALWACYVPARRAMRLDPMNALRHE